MKINPYKVKKISSILRTVMNVLFWATIVVGIIFVAACLVLAFYPDDISKLLQTGRMSISFYFGGIVSSEVDLSVYEASGLKQIFLTVIPAVILGASMLAVILRQVINILKSVEKDNPFEEKNSKRLTIVAAVLIIGSAILNAAKYAIAAAVIGSFHILNLDVRYSLDTTMLITGLLILILAGVFKYGSFLQKEFDATL